MRPISGAQTQPFIQSPRRLAWLAAIACAAGSCAAAPARPQKYPGTSQTLCQYVGLESVETPQYSNQDSISLLAVYRFREKSAPPPKEPLTVKFQVNRTRLNELRSHLESQPEVVCAPDSDTHYHVYVKPFEVKPSTPEPQPAIVVPKPPAAPDAGPPAAP